MKSRDAKLGLLMIVALFTLVPIVYGIDFSAGIVFQGGGGNVTFAQAFSAYRVVLGPNRFYRFTWGGHNRGVLGFDVDAGSNMTVTSVAERTIMYTIDPGGGAPLHSQVYWDAYGGPTRVTGADHMNYDESTGVATLTSTGAVTVTLFYADISHSMWDAGKGLADLFTLVAVICIFAAFDEARGGFENGKLIAYLMVLAVVMAVAAVIAGWGY